MRLWDIITGNTSKQMRMFFFHPKTTDKKYKKEVFALLCIIVPLYFYWLFVKVTTPDVEYCIKRCKESLDYEIHGLVLKPISNTHPKSVQLLTSEGLTIYSSLGIKLSELTHLRLHDSVSKEKGSFDVHIFRKGEKIWSIRDLCNDCEIRCNDKENICN